MHGSPSAGIRIKRIAHNNQFRSPVRGPSSAVARGHTYQCFLCEKRRKSCVARNAANLASITIYLTYAFLHYVLRMIFRGLLASGHFPECDATLTQFPVTRIKQTMKKSSVARAQRLPAVAETSGRRVVAILVRPEPAKGARRQ